jgi:ankyrin repeat protein
MEHIIKEFIGEYLPPEGENFREDFHDPLEKGFLFSNDLDLIEKYLFEFPYLINQQSNYFANSTLYIACEYDMTDVVYLLLSYGANISLKNIFGWSAYDVAWYHNSLDSIELIRKKAVIIIEKAWINYYTKKYLIEDIVYNLENSLSLS